MDISQLMQIHAQVVTIDILPLIGRSIPRDRSIEIVVKVNTLDTTDITENESLQY